MEATKNTRMDVAVKEEVREDASTAALLALLPAKRDNSFIMKLYNMLNLNEYPDIVKWNREGTSFTIAKRPEFISIVLQKFFGGVKMSSFLRQLNMYSFTKDSDPNSLTYTNPCFTKANAALLKLIKRRQFPAHKEENASIDFVNLENVAAVRTALDSAFAHVKTEPSSQEASTSSVVPEENSIKLPKFNSNRPIVSPHSPEPRAQLFAGQGGVCRRCAQVEHLFAQEDPFKSVFEEEEDNHGNATQDPETPTLDATESCFSEENPFFASSTFSAFKADSKYFDNKDLYTTK